MSRRRRRKNKNSSFLSIVIVILAVAWGIYTKAGNDPAGTTNQSSQPQTAAVAKKVYGGLAKKDYQHLAQEKFHSGDYGYQVVNHNHSTLIKRAWKVNRVIYANLDGLNRTSHSNTAFLMKRNVANDSLRVRQFVEPTAWHYNHGSRQIYNRGHLIAYSISAGIDQDGDYQPDNRSGDQNNPKNLFTQTAFANQRIQTIFEAKVRQALRQNKKVIYQATAIFAGQELMARGVNLQAVSTDGSLDFNVYIFNVQPGYRFNYQNGQAKSDRQMLVKE